MHIVELPIDTLKPYAQNPRINDAAVDAVCASLREFGWQQPLVLDQDHTVIIGHTRLKAAQRLGMATVPCVIADGLTPEQVKALRIADNKTGEIAEWDMALLPEELRALCDLGYDATLTGFSLEDIGDLLAGGDTPTDGAIDPDAAPEAPKAAKSQSGALYTLGEHRLLCGDATRTDDVRKVMDGDTAALWLTDPPYNVAYEGSDGKTIQNNNMEDSAFRDFLAASFKAAVAAVDDVTLTWGELTRMAPADDRVAYEAVQAFIFSTLVAKEAQARGVVLDDAAWRDFSAQFAEATGLSPDAYAAAHGGEGTLAALRAEALGWLFLDRVVYRGLAVLEEDLAADRARVAAEAAEARRRMEGFQAQVALGADFAALVREHSGVTAPIRVSLGEMEASWPPELVLRVTGIPVGAVTDIVELPGMLAMYQVAAREGEDFTLRVLALPLPTPNEALDDYLLLWRREEAYWAWFEEACHRHRVRCPLFPDLAPAQ